MNSRKVCSSNEEINYENIPTQRNEIKQKNNKSQNNKEKKISLKYINNMRMSINPISSRSKKFQRNILEVKDIKLNKISRNNNIKEFKIMKKIGNKTSINHNKNKSVINNTHLIPGNINKNQSNIPHINQIRESSKQNKKLQQKAEDSPNKCFQCYQNKNNDNQNSEEMIFSADEIKLSTKEMPFLSSSSNKKNKNCYNSNIVHKANNVSFISGLSCTKSMAEIENNINKLYEWEKRRRKKIEKMKNLKDKQIKRYTYKPKISKRSNSLAMKLKLKKEKEKENENIFERLSKEDPLIKEKKKILKDLFTPSFQPQIFSTYRKIYHNRNQSCVEKKENKDEYIIKVNRINFVKKKDNNKIDDDEEEEGDEKINEDDIMQNLLRKTIINNINNKFKSNSAVKRKNKMLSL